MFKKGNNFNMLYNLFPCKYVFSLTLFIMKELQEAFLSLGILKKRVAIPLASMPKGKDWLNGAPIPGL